MRLIAEFTTEPFRGEGEPPAHARAALEAVDRSTLECTFGPLGTTVAGEEEDVVLALTDVLRGAFAQGAARVTLQVSRQDLESGAAPDVGPDA